MVFAEGGTCSQDCQGFGQVGNTASSSSAYENALPNGTIPRSVLNRNIAGAGGIGTNNVEGNNIFQYPLAVYQQFRRCVLGLDQNCGGTGNLRGLHRWNADATLAKDVKFTERVGASFTLQFTNVFNHRQPSDPPNSSSSFLSLSSPTNFGKITGSTYAARQLEFGLRIHF